MSKVAPIPSSASHGFFQAKPKLENPYLEDAAFRRTLDFFLPTATQQAIAGPLTQFGDKVLSPQILLWLQSAEIHPPTLVLRDSFGSPRNELVTSEGWRQTQDFAIREGIVAAGYENEHGIHTRLVQFAKIHIFGASSSTVTCPAAMQDGAAKLIKLHLRDEHAVLDGAARSALESAYQRLTSRDPSRAWTSGQWMTERPGGSDVSGTETRAKLLSQADIEQGTQARATDGSLLGPWSVDGFKWFSSATDANMAVFLAKTDSTDRVSLFFAPVRRHTDSGTATQFNGVYPQRLKNKMGTKPLPTAELELKGMRAHMIGKEGFGTKEISPVLNVTRLYNAISSVSALGRGLAISRAFARVRRALGGRLLMDVPAHVRGMARQHVEYRGHNMMAFYVAYLLGITEAEKPLVLPLPLVASPSWTPHLLRLLTPVAKAMTALAAVDGVRFCMESLGGLGYLENEDVELNVAKILRDTNVLPIWEGTTDVLAADTVRVVKGHGGREALAALAGWSSSMFTDEAVNAAGLDVRTLSAEVEIIGQMVREQDAPELLYRGRELLDRINWIVITTMLVADAIRDREAVAVEVAKRWLAQRDDAVAERLRLRSWVECARMDRMIVFGDGPQIEPELARL